MFEIANQRAQSRIRRSLTNSKSSKAIAVNYMYYMNYDDPLSDIDLESNSSGFEEIAWSSDYVEDDSDIASLSGFSENEVESDVEGNPDDPDYYCSASPYTFRFEQLNLPSLMGVLAQQDNLNVFVEGKVGSGKTTFMNTLCQLLEGDFKKRTDMINVMPYFVIKTNYSKHFSHTYCWQKRALKNLMKSVSRRSKLIQIYENSVDMK